MNMVTNTQLAGVATLIFAFTLLINNLSGKVIFVLGAAVLVIGLMLVKKNG